MMKNEEENVDKRMANWILSDEDSLPEPPIDFISLTPPPDDGAPHPGAPPIFRRDLARATPRLLALARGRGGSAGFHRSVKGCGVLVAAPSAAV